MVINRIPFCEPNKRKGGVGIDSPASALQFPSTSQASVPLADQILVLIRDPSSCDSGLTYLSRTS